MKLTPIAPTVRWMTEWVEVQKEKMLDLLERGWETMQPLHRPHDQVWTAPPPPKTPGVPAWQARAPLEASQAGLARQTPPPAACRRHRCVDGRAPGSQAWG